jgi:hypothetical protein
VSIRFIPQSFTCLEFARCAPRCARIAATAAATAAVSSRSPADSPDGRRCATRRSAAIERTSTIRNPNTVSMPTIVITSPSTNSFTSHDLRARQRRPRQSLVRKLWIYPRRRVPGRQAVARRRTRTTIHNISTRLQSLPDARGNLNSPNVARPSWLARRGSPEMAVATPLSDTAA